MLPSSHGAALDEEHYLLMDSCGTIIICQGICLSHYPEAALSQANTLKHLVVDQRQLSFDSKILLLFAILDANLSVTYFDKLNRDKRHD